ncbi:hypothetical protein SK128_016582, partial [Halocaridina rubra]
IKDIDSMGMNDLLAKARVLTAGGGKEVVAVASKGLTAVENQQNLQHQRDMLSGRKEETCGFSSRYFTCGGSNIARECKELNPDIIC